jgi:ribonuclease P/MRP protein subunit RPP1
MYEAVHARPEGDSTVSRLALAAEAYGFHGIVVRNHGDRPASFDPDAVREAAGIDVISGVEIRAEDPAQASGYLGGHRDDLTVVLIHGGDPDVNRFAVEQAAVDVLAHPMADDGDVNHVLARTARENGVRLEFNLRDVLRTEGGDRVAAIRDLRKLWRLVDTYDTPYVVSADPRSHLQLRAPRELTALGDVIGIPPEAIESGLREWGRLAERNRDRHSDAFVEPGVRRVPDDDEDDSAPTEE